MTKGRSRRRRDKGKYAKPNKPVTSQQDQVEMSDCFNVEKNVDFPGIPRILGNSESYSARNSECNSKQTSPKPQVRPTPSNDELFLTRDFVQNKTKTGNNTEDSAQTSARSVSTSTYSHMPSEISLDSNFKLVKPDLRNFFHQVILNGEKCDNKYVARDNTFIPHPKLGRKLKQAGDFTDIEINNKATPITQFNARVNSNIAKSSAMPFKKATKLTLQSSKIEPQQPAIISFDLDDFHDCDDGSEVLSNVERVEKKPVRSAPFFNFTRHLKADWLQQFRLKWEEKKNLCNLTAKVNKLENKTRSPMDEMQEITERLSRIKLPDADIIVIDDESDDHSQEADKQVPIPLPEVFSAEQNARIQAAMRGPPYEVLVSKFKITITRRDIKTLDGLNWLNDEVINFYMNLLIERNAASVYAMNTFFIPRLLQSGHAGVKRWTRRIDIFSKEIIPVPVHVAGIHWAMAIIHLKCKTIKYYDSMCKPNPRVLIALAQYLVDEYQDKKKQSLDISQFVLESVHNIPRQLNSSDCGVFSCMFAEYISRSAKITFSQENMTYFRHKMILEILRGELLT